MERFYEKPDPRCHYRLEPDGCYAGRITIPPTSNWIYALSDEIEKLCASTFSPAGIASPGVAVAAGAGVHGKGSIAGLTVLPAGAIPKCRLAASECRSRCGNTRMPIFPRRSSTASPASRPARATGKSIRQEVSF
jgi:hypothetical protein